MSKTLTATFKNPDGSAVANGMLYMKLSQDAVVSGSGQIAPTLLTFPLDANGTLGTGVTLFGNDELTPTGTVYTVTVTITGGGQVYGPEFFSITGVSPINLNSLSPAAGSPVVFSQAVLQNPTAPQTITGQSLTLAASAPLIANGNVTLTSGAVPATPNGAGLGTSALPFVSIVLGNGGLGANLGVSLSSSPSAVALRTVNFPDASGNAVVDSATQTLTNKSTSAGALAGVVASGTSTLTSNAALGATTSQAAITTGATNALTTDAIEWAYASAPGAGDSLCIVSAYVTAGNVNFVRSNPTAAAQNVSALIINWRVLR